MAGNLKGKKMGKCVSVNLEDLQACSKARVKLITETRPGYMDTDEHGYDEFIPEQVTRSIIVNLWPNIQVTMDLNIEDSIAWSCDRNGHVFSLLSDYGIPCHEF